MQCANAKRCSCRMQLHDSGCRMGSFQCRPLVKSTIIIARALDNDDNHRKMMTMRMIMITFWKLGPSNSLPSPKTHIFVMSNRIQSVTSESDHLAPFSGARTVRGTHLATFSLNMPKVKLPFPDSLSNACPAASAPRRFRNAHPFSDA